jgi:hypothetical protein
MIREIDNLIYKNKLNEMNIPDYMHDGLINYIKHHVKPGHFLSAILQNNLRETFFRADYINVNLVKNYVKFLYNYAPSSCWGNQERFENWLEMKS